LKVYEKASDKKKKHTHIHTKQEIINSSNSSGSQQYNRRKVKNYNVYEHVNHGYWCQKQFLSENKLSVCPQVLKEHGTTLR